MPPGQHRALSACATICAWPEPHARQSAHPAPPSGRVPATFWPPPSGPHLLEPVALDRSKPGGGAERAPGRAGAYPMLAHRATGLGGRDMLSPSLPAGAQPSRPHAPEGTPCRQNVRSALRAGRPPPHAPRKLWHKPLTAWPARPALRQWAFQLRPECGHISRRCLLFRQLLLIRAGQRRAKLPRALLRREVRKTSAMSLR